MCTAITLKTKDHYFGRNLDLEYSYDETVTITPRNFVLSYRKEETQISHYAIAGMAYVADGYPLYYDALNEMGVGMAGLNFPGNTCYQEQEGRRYKIAPFELIPWVLGQCRNITEVCGLLRDTSIIPCDFSEGLPSAPLHWIITDGKSTITVEATEKGMEIIENPIGVLTNNPPFGYHLMNLNNYMNVTSLPPVDRFSGKGCLQPYGSGMGGIGLPGDCSSASRFIRASFMKYNSVSGGGELESVNQFFHILGNLEFVRGCATLKEGLYDITVYTSCCNLDKGIYYYTTYENRKITGVDMHMEDLGSSTLICYPLLKGEINIQNSRE